MIVTHRSIGVLSTVVNNDCRVRRSRRGARRGVATAGARASPPARPGRASSPYLPAGIRAYTAVRHDRLDFKSSRSNQIWELANQIKSDTAVL